MALLLPRQLASVLARPLLPFELREQLAAASSPSSERDEGADGEEGPIARHLRKSVEEHKSEVAALLALAAQETNPARRWLPLLGACSGARAGELAQLSADRVLVIDGVHVLDLKPAEDGGSFKNAASERLVDRPHRRDVVPGHVVLPVSGSSRGLRHASRISSKQGSTALRRRAMGTSGRTPQGRTHLAWGPAPPPLRARPTN